MVNQCKNCGKLIGIHGYTGLCRSCINLERWKNEAFGMKRVPEKFCEDCNKKMNKYHDSLHCQSCASKRMWKDKTKSLYLRSQNKKRYFCLNCNKEITRNHTRCGSCARKLLLSNPENHPMYGKKIPYKPRKSLSKEAIERMKETKKQRYSPEKHPSWKGGKRNYYQSQARKIMGVTDSNTAVHHLDGDYTNNNPDNLLVLPRNEHTRLHLFQGGTSFFKKGQIPHNKKQGTS